MALGNVEEDLNEWIPRVGLDNLLKVSQAVAHCDGHDEAHASVEIDRPHD